MKIEFDKLVNILYLRLRPGTVERTIEFAQDVYLDIDDEGHVLGAEFVNAGDFFAILNQHDGKLDIPERIPA
ncbi:MAG TPA: DUF2283 domain-containing protein [Nitrolancea sp.]|nr:DUF2283 domain-containing protein [Nitrolancea sp.]